MKKENTEKIIIDFLKWFEPKLSSEDRELCIENYKEEIEWEFEEWAEKSVGVAFVKGCDNFGNDYKGTAHYACGKIQEIIEYEKSN